MTVSEFRKMALELPGVEEIPHFERRAFRLVGKKIFASLHEPTASANIGLPSDEQAEFCELGKGALKPLENAWGKKGWTAVDLKNAPPEVVAAAIETAFEASLGKRNA